MTNTSKLSAFAAAQCKRGSDWSGVRIQGWWLILLCIHAADIFICAKIWHSGGVWLVPRITMRFAEMLQHVHLKGGGWADQPVAFVCDRHDVARGQQIGPVAGLGLLHGGLC